MDNSGNAISFVRRPFHARPPLRVSSSSAPARPRRKGAVPGGAAREKRLALIEKEHVLGGGGANKGSLLSKTLRETALALIGFRQRGLPRRYRDAQGACDREAIFLIANVWSASWSKPGSAPKLERHHVVLFTGAPRLSINPHAVRIATNDALRPGRDRHRSVILFSRWARTPIVRRSFPPSIHKSTIRTVSPICGIA